MAIVNESTLPILEAETDYEACLRSVVNEIKEGLHLEKVLMQERMARNARYEQAVTDARTVDGLGQRTMRIPARVYFRIGQERGWGFWKDRKEVEKFLKDNPECRAAKPQKRFF